MEKIKMTYVDFANVAIALANEVEFETEALKQAFIDKANDLIAANEKKAEYNKEKRAGQSRVKPETKELAAKIKAVLTDNPLTSAEIAALVDKDLTALRIANVIKYADGVVKTKVVRAVENSKGLLQEKEFVAYKLG